MAPLAFAASFLSPVVRDAAWSVAGLGGLLSLVFAPIALLSGLFCLSDRGVRRAGLWGMAMAGGATVLWIIYAVVVIHLMFSSPGCC